MKNIRILAVLLALAMLLSCSCVALADDVVEFPRTETLYVFDHWGTINGWNPIGENQNNGLAVKGNAGGSRTLIYETLYMYNSLDGSLRPLLADGDYVWNDSMTELTVKIKEAAHWSDGTPVTAYDVAQTWDTGVYMHNGSTGYTAYIAGVEAADEKTVVIKAVLTEDGKAANPPDAP